MLILGCRKLEGCWKTGLYLNKGVLLKICVEVYLLEIFEEHFVEHVRMCC